MPPRTYHSRPLWLGAAVLVCLVTAAPSHAEVAVAGEPHAVSVEAHDAAVEEVLTALGKSFGVQHRSSVPLARRVTGSYKGPLDRVVRRLLEGYDFVVKSNADALEVLVISGGKGGGSVAAPPAVPLPAAQRPAPQPDAAAAAAASPTEASAGQPAAQVPMAAPARQHGRQRRRGD